MSPAPEHNAPMGFPAKAFVRGPSLVQLVACPALIRPLITQDIPIAALRRPHCRLSSRSGIFHVYVAYVLGRGDRRHPFGD